MTLRSYTINRSYTEPWPNGSTYTVAAKTYSNDSVNSTRNIKNELVLKANPHSMQRCIILKRLVTKDSGLTSVYDESRAYSAQFSSPQFQLRDLSWTFNDNRALARWQGLLRYGGASLGITIAQWKQTNSMVLDRFSKLNKLLGITEQRLKRNLRTKAGRRRFKRDRALGITPKRRIVRDPLASQVLEYEFGWAPLVSDITKACTTLVAHSIPDTYVSARSSTQHDVAYGKELVLQNAWQEVRQVASLRTTISAAVAIENPNTWLANRAGLIDLPGIAWDAIPWSFLVNQFVNVNQFLSQLTNETGLTITDRSTTHTQKCFTFTTDVKRYSVNHAYTYTWQKHQLVSRQRVVGVFPSVKLQYRSPELDPEKLLIASALVVQKVKSISRILDVVYHTTRR